MHSNQGRSNSGWLVLREEYPGCERPQRAELQHLRCNSKEWRQSWVTNRGQLLLLDGELRDGEMVLSGAGRTPDGRERQVRGSWRPIIRGRS